MIGAIVEEPRRRSPISFPVASVIRAELARNISGFYSRVGERTLQKLGTRTASGCHNTICHRLHNEYE